MVIISFAPSWGGYASILRVGRRLSRGDGSLSLSLSLVAMAMAIKSSNKNGRMAYFSLMHLAY